MRTRGWLPGVLAACVLLLLRSGDVSGQVSPVNVTSVSFSAVSPVQYGTTIVLTAQATGGIAPLEYQFWRYSYASGKWTLAQDYSIAPTYAWDPGPTDVGAYAYQVWVRSSSSTAPYEAYRGTSIFVITDASYPPIVVSPVVVAPPSPAPYGTPITWTTAASGGAAPLQYQVWHYSYASARWNLARDYSADPTYFWTPTANDAGDHAWQVWVRSAGSAAPFEAFRGTGRFTITTQPPIVALTNPANGTTFGAPATVLLRADASDPDGSITTVDFLTNSAIVATIPTGPYEVGLEVSNVGTYVLTARGTDNSGLATTSTPVTINATPSLAVFSASADDGIVERYVLEFFADGSNPDTATPVASVDLGKPPIVNGEITVDVTSPLVPIPPGTYIATVTARSATGSSRSAPSNSFAR